MNVLLLDGYNLLYRAFASLPRSVVSDDGLPINAVYGALSAVIKLLREPGGDAAVLALDTPEVPTFRHALLPTYQGQRGPLGGEHAEDFARQVGIAAEVFPQWGIPAVAAPGYEADDVMGTYAMSVVRAGGVATIVTTDRDLLQLVRPGVEVLVPGTEPRTYRTEADVRERLGVGPGGVTNWKALAGDASDNVPGIKGIGPKTAVALVERYGNLEDIFAALNELTPRTAALIRDHQDVAMLYRDVVTVHTTLALNPEVGQFPKLSISAETRVRDALAAVGYGRP